MGTAWGIGIEEDEEHSSRVCSSGCRKILREFEFEMNSVVVEEHDRPRDDPLASETSRRMRTCEVVSSQLCDLCVVLLIMR